MVANETYQAANHNCGAADTAIGIGRTVVEQTRNDLAGMLHELARIAHSDIRRIFDASGNPKPLEEIDPDTRAAIGPYSVSDHRFEIAFGGKDAARELLLRHLASEACGDRREPNPQERELRSVASEIEAPLAAMTKSRRNTGRRNRQRCSR